MKKKENDILVLFFNNPDSKSIFLEHFDATEGLQARCVMKNVGKLLRILRKAHMNSNFPGIGIWFLQWKKLVEKNKKVICMASDYTPRILKWIKKKEPSTKLVNYYWDRVDIAGYPIEKTGDYENWSFCREDCKLYHMHYNPQFYIRTMMLPFQDILYDVSFIGADREGNWSERCRLVAEYYELLRGMGLSVFFYCVSKSSLIPEEIREDARLAEDEFNLTVSKSKAVLEIVQPGQEWITLRPLLALSNGKKVITNNKLIMEERFYTKENIFILGVDDEKRLLEFVKESFVPIEEEIMAFYNVESWSKRFFEK